MRDSIRPRCEILIVSEMYNKLVFLLPNYVIFYWFDIESMNSGDQGFDQSKP